MFIVILDFIQPFYKMGDNKATKISKYLGKKFLIQLIQFPILLNVSQ